MNREYIIIINSCSHVGILSGGDLCSVGQVDIGRLGERTVDILVVDVLDHGLKY